MNLYYVRTDNDDTDTAMEAQSKRKAIEKAESSPFWKKNNLKVLVADKIAVLDYNNNT